MAWKQYILQKKQISTDAGLTWVDAEPYTTRVGDPVATFDSYEECMNMLYRWIPSEIEYCDYQVNANSKAVFSVTPNLYVKPEEEELRKFAVYRYGLDKNGDDDVYITLEETSQFDKTELTDATFFEGVQEIENGAFKGFTNLSAVTLSSTITNIGEGAFQNCTKITNINIPNSVITIGGGAFAGCTGLTSATIGNNVTTIGNSVFQSCSGLTSIVIPDSVTSIGQSAFYSCSRLTGIVIPDSVTYIGQDAFNSCISFTNIVIPDSVTTIGQWAFSSCVGLTSLTVEATTPPSLGSYAFYNTSCQILVPAESVELYKSTSGWSDYSSRIQAISV